MRSSPKITVLPKCRWARAVHSCLIREPASAPGGSDERAGAGPGGALGRLLDARVAVDGVHEALHPDQSDKVVTQDGLAVDVGPGAELVEGPSGQGVVGDHDRPAAEFESTGEHGSDRPVVGRRGQHPNPVRVEDHACCDRADALLGRRVRSA